MRLKPLPIFEPTIRKLHDAQSSPAPALSPQPAPLLPAAAPAIPAPALLVPATPELFNFRFGAAKGFKLKLERLAEVLGIENPAKSMAEVLEKALELALEAKDPQRRLERRLARKQRREEAAVESKNVAAESRPGEVETSGPATSRHVPAAVRDRVFQRAGHPCQFTGPDGTRCTARTGLEIEHTVPFAMRPEHDEPGLEILCAPHNRLRAEQAYGARYIHAKITERRLAGRVERERKTSGRRCLQVALTESPARGPY